MAETDAKKAAEAPAEPAKESAPPAAGPAETKAPAKRPRAGKKAEAAKAPRRPKLSEEAQRLLAARSSGDGRRPRFTRQASYRYWRIGRDGAWRRPRGQQSKQRRHYGYRSTIVRIGYRGPRAVRGLTPTGFRPVLVRTAEEIEALAPSRDAALIARTVGTRRRLALEETARKAGVHVLNPITREGREE